MSKSVSNDALWEKLSEIEEKINRHLKEQKVSHPIEEQVDLTPELRASKDEIVEIFKKSIQGLGTHCDSHFKTMYKHLEQLEKDTEGTYKVLASISAILQESKKQQETKPEPEQDKSYLYFKFFKVRKSSIVITVLGLLVLTLTVFCMKQQNDYTLLNNVYYRQSIVLKEIQAEVDSLQIKVKPKNEMKQK
ncbi:hypothetical protein M2132_002269 [Dysgonomonas sp. PH5-45]|uniref:hypothetical protein n=1 Tax=unclassified Dysgonomonas TaxID=2630389 RepID=UPI002476D17C|nr:MULTISPECIES: hypothetical protein [unclassified Dysgonomonas]MDH6355918.1 hypothetical protein [Dysgonomonas sp. PH5-45]MDH6388813.1 hypothetical protein [Dysgonomonas sp. PH5-37]